MQKTLKYFFPMLAVAVMSLGSLSAHAAKEEGAPAEGCVGLKFATGPSGKGYSKLFSDIARTCSAKVPVCEVTTSGGLDNLNSLSTKEADVGIAQIDTWSTMKAGDENIAGLQAVAGLNFNYLHVVVSSSGFAVSGEKKMMGLMKGDSTRVVVQRFSDLRGKTVAVVGSAQLLARQIDKQIGFGMQFVDMNSDAEAFAAVKAGRIAAAMSVSGWPSGSIKPLKQDSGLTMVPFDIPAPGSNFVVRSVNYKGLGVYNNNMLATPNVLLTRPFKGEKSAQVAALKSCIASNLQALQEGEFEPAWNEIKSLDNTFDIPKFQSSSAPAKKK